MNNVHTTARRLLVSAALLATLASIAACGGGESAADIPGVDVRGMQLPDAQAALKNEGVATTVDDDGVFGVLVPEHWTVCDEHTVNDAMVRLEVSKDC